MTGDTAIGLAAVLLGIVGLAAAGFFYRRSEGSLRDAVRELRESLSQVESTAKNVETATTDIAGRLLLQVDTATGRLTDVVKESETFYKALISKLIGGLPETGGLDQAGAETTAARAVRAAATQTVREAILRWAGSRHATPLGVSDLCQDLHRQFDPPDVRAELVRMGNEGMIRFIGNAGPYDRDSTFVLVTPVRSGPDAS